MVDRAGTGSAGLREQWDSRPSPAIESGTGALGAMGQALASCQNMWHSRIGNIGLRQCELLPDASLSHTHTESIGGNGKLYTGAHPPRANPAGLAPIGCTGQDGDARSPFGLAPEGGGAAVDSGRYEVCVPLRHRPPVLQIVGPAQARIALLLRYAFD